MPSKLTDAEKKARDAKKASEFVRIASRRVTVVLAGLNALSKCSNPASYSYTPAQIAKQNAAIDAAVTRCKNAFEKQEAPAAEGFSY